MTDIKWVYITVPSREEAEKIANAVVTEQLAACANILPGATSIFEWEGRLCREEETVLIIKTTETRTDQLTIRIKELHSYDCPCVIVLPIETGNPDFLQWIQHQLNPGATGAITGK